MGAHSVRATRAGILARVWHVFKVATFVAGIIFYLLLIVVFA